MDLGLHVAVRARKERLLRHTVRLSLIPPKEIANRVQASVRAYDLTGRYGGEEFLIVMPGCPYESVITSAERIRAAIAADPIDAEGTGLSVTVGVVDPRPSFRDPARGGRGCGYGAVSGQAERAQPGSFFRRAQVNGNRSLAPGPWAAR